MFPRALNGLVAADVDTGTGAGTDVAPATAFPQEHPVFPAPVAGSVMVTTWHATPSGQEPLQLFVLGS
jgi:hypothetical protein